MVALALARRGPCGHTCSGVNACSYAVPAVEVHLVGASNSGIVWARPRWPGVPCSRVCSRAVRRGDAGRYTRYFSRIRGSLPGSRAELLDVTEVDHSLGHELGVDCLDTQLRRRSGGGPLLSSNTDSRCPAEEHTRPSSRCMCSSLAMGTFATTAVRPLSSRSNGL